MIEKCVWGINHEPLLRKYARGLDHKMRTETLKEIREHLADCEECRSFVADNDEPFEHNPRDSEYDSEEGQAFREIDDNFDRCFGRGRYQRDPFKD